VNNQLPNCPVSSKDKVTAEAIFGPDMCPQRKQEKSTLVSVGQSISIPEQYKDIMLAIDIMYINVIPFFITTSRKIQFGSAPEIPDRTFK